MTDQQDPVRSSSIRKGTPMTHPPTRWRTFVLGAVVIAAALSGCGTDSPPRATDDHVRIDPLNPADLDADGTATTAMQAILSWQPAIDAGKADAMRRARPWLGGDLAVTVDHDDASPSGVAPDREWLAWKESGDAVTASCARAASTPAAPQGMRTLVIDVSCRQTVLHATGSSTPRPAQTWRTTVTRTDNGWRLTDFRYQQGK